MRKKSKISFTSFFAYTPTFNRFKGLPSDLMAFLHHPDGTVSSIVENLEPEKNYEIKITITEKDA